MIRNCAFTCLKCKPNNRWTIKPTFSGRRLLTTATAGKHLCSWHAVRFTQRPKLRTDLRHFLISTSFTPRIFYCTNSRMRDNSVLQPYTADWTVKELTVECCRDMYIPRPEGIQMEVKYVDTASHLSDTEKSAMPTVLALHGSPGTHEHWRSLVQPLADQGLRIVMPNFPGFGMTEGADRLTNKMFGHSLEEKVDFIGNFIHQLDLSRLDLVLGHSAACYVLTALSVEHCGLPSPQAYVFVCPATGPGHPKGLRPYWFIQFIVTLWENTLLRPLAVLLIRLLTLRMTQGIIPGNKPSQVAAMLQTMTSQRNYLMPKLASHICLDERPMLYVYCDRDPLVGDSQNVEYARLFGIEPEAFDEYDHHGNRVAQGQRNTKRFAQGIKFHSRGHYPLKNAKYCQTILEEILNLYNFEKSSKL